MQDAENLFVDNPCTLMVDLAFIPLGKAAFGDALLLVPAEPDDIYRESVAFAFLPLEDAPGIDVSKFSKDFTLPYELSDNRRLLTGGTTLVARSSLPSRRTSRYPSINDDIRLFDFGFLTGLDDKSRDFLFAYGKEPIHLDLLSRGFSEEEIVESRELAKQRHAEMIQRLAKWPEGHQFYTHGIQRIEMLFGE